MKLALSRKNAEGCDRVCCFLGGFVVYWVCLGYLLENAGVGVGAYLHRRAGWGTKKARETIQSHGLFWRWLLAN